MKIIDFLAMQIRCFCANILIFSLFSIIFSMYRYKIFGTAAQAGSFLYTIKCELTYKHQLANLRYQAICYNDIQPRTNAYIAIRATTNIQIHNTFSGSVKNDNFCSFRCDTGKPAPCS